MLREALQLPIEREAGGHEKYHALREELRRNIETAYREMLAGDTVDANEFMQQLRQELEA